MNEIERIKTEIPIKKIAEKYLEIDQCNKALCPFHNDHNPSLSLDLKRNRFKCFACGASGSVIDLVMKLENKTFTEAVYFLKVFSGIDCKEPSKINPKTQKKENSVIIPRDKQQEICSYFNQLIKLTDIGKRYLKNRGLSDKTIVKFDIKSIDKPKNIADQLKNKFSTAELKASGLFTDKGFIFWQPAIIFPYYRKGKPIYFTSRNLSGEVKCFKMAGKERFYLGSKNKQIFIFEGIFDALSYYQLTGEDNFISINGKITAGKTGQIKKYYKGSKLILGFDNDIAGAKARLQMEKQKINVLSWQSLFDLYSINEKDVYRQLKKENVTIKTKQQTVKTAFHSEVKDLNELLLAIKEKATIKDLKDDRKFKVKLLKTNDNKKPLNREQRSFINTYIPESYNGIISYNETALMELTKKLERL